MGQPAARVLDFHSCPMVTPGTPPVPHVGGPVLPGGVTVFTGKMPAARVGDMCLCVGPPDIILTGAFTVLINKQPGARMSSLTAHGGQVAAGCPTVLLGEGLSAIGALVTPEVFALIIQSPTLVADLIKLNNEGWVIKAGKRGKGSFANRTKREIEIDSNDLPNRLHATQLLAHEAGHAVYNPEPEVPMDGLTRDEYVTRNTDRDLRDEGEATLVNAEVREEILDTSGGKDDIGIAGQNSQSYQQSYENYKEHGDRNAARDEIGKKFARGEKPSGNRPEKDYGEYYSRPYENKYDNANPPRP